MQGQRGASIESTRRIWRRMYKAYRANKAYLATRQTAPGWNPEGISAKLLTESIEMERSALGGKCVPVGCRADFWRQVCAEEAKTNPV